MLGKIKEISKTAFGKLIFVVVFVISFLAVKELKTQWFQSIDMQDASKRVAHEMEENIKSAQNQATKDRSTIEVLQQESYKKTANALSSASTVKEKLTVASDLFFGAYFSNTRTRTDYCASLGAPIKSFVNAYEQKHHQLFISAKRIQILDFREHGIPYDLDKFYKLVLPSTEKMIAQDMKDAASALKISEQEVCQSMEQNSVEWVNEMDYRKRAPEIAQVLLRK